MHRDQRTNMPTDAEDLAVEIVPIYIQEKIHPQALIQDLRVQAKTDAEPGTKLKVFGGTDSCSTNMMKLHQVD